MGMLTNCRCLSPGELENKLGVQRIDHQRAYAATAVSLQRDDETVTAAFGLLGYVRSIDHHR